MPFAPPIPPPPTTLENWTKALTVGLVERDEDAGAILLALVAGEHCLLIGDPGTAKSLLANALGTSTNQQVFTYLMNRFTERDEIFGPLDISALDKGEYRRMIAGHLPTCKIAFLDEIFKSSSSILNSLLSILNERVYDEMGKRTSIPLEICIGASNEVPDADEGLEALRDRFLLCRDVRPIREQRAFVEMLMGDDAAPAPIPWEEVEKARARAKKIVLDPTLAAAMAKLKADLATDGIFASDRRWRKCVKLLKASAVLHDRDVIEVSDFRALIDALWRVPPERATIENRINKITPVKALAPAKAPVDLAALAQTAGQFSGLSDHAKQFIPPAQMKNPTNVAQAARSDSIKSHYMQVCREKIAQIRNDQIMIDGEKDILLKDWEIVQSMYDR